MKTIIIISMAGSMIIFILTDLKLMLLMIKFWRRLSLINRKMMPLLIK
jgi:hypothetical protein